MRMTKNITYNKTNVPIFILPSFLFSPFSISHSNIMNMEISVSNFTGTTTPRIDTNFFETSHCVFENQPPPAYIFLYLSGFLLLS